MYAKFPFVVVVIASSQLMTYVSPRGRHQTREHSHVQQNAVRDPALLNNTRSEKEAELRNSPPPGNSDHEEVLHDSALDDPKYQPAPKVGFSQLYHPPPPPTMDYGPKYRRPPSKGKRPAYYPASPYYGYNSGYYPATAADYSQVYDTAADYDGYNYGN